MAIRIEVCKRLMDYRMHPVYDEKNGQYVLQQSARYRAQVVGKPGVWAAGDTIDDAIGNLVRCRPEEFGIELIILEGSHPR